MAIKGEHGTVMSVRLSQIDPNPWRDLEKYPLVDRKVEALINSISMNGFWEGVIARPHPSKAKRFQLAFGHNRVGAARKALGENGSIPIIVRMLDDKEMVRFMASENTQDYNTDFVRIYEGWEGASRLLGTTDAKAVAEFLGMIRRRNDANRAKDGPEWRPDVSAQVCTAVQKLIERGDIELHDLRELSVKAVREICLSLNRRIELMDKKVDQHKKLADSVGREGPDPGAVVEVKKTYSKAAKEVAEAVRKGEIATTQAYGAVWSKADVETVSKRMPTFDVTMSRHRAEVRAWAAETWTKRQKALLAAYEYTSKRERQNYEGLLLDLRQAQQRIKAAADYLEKFIQSQKVNGEVKQIEARTS